MADIAVYDHLRPTTDGVPPGVYRVVGTASESVTLLRVADGDGRRAHTGDIHTVARRDLDAFELTENPDDSRSMDLAPGSLAKNAYWSLRTFLTTLAADPVPSAIALTLFAVGRFGGGIVPLPGTVLFGLSLAGLGAIVYIGTGHY
jgi:hypothetical protein